MSLRIREGFDGLKYGCFLFDVLIIIFKIGNYWYSSFYVFMREVCDGVC